MIESSFTNLVVVGFSSVAVTETSHFAPASSKEFIDIQETVECVLTLKRVRDMTRTYSHFFLSGYSFTSSHDSQDIRERGMLSL